MPSACLHGQGRGLRELSAWSHLPLGMQVGDEMTLTIRDPNNIEGPAIGVSYDAFVDDVSVRHMHMRGP